MPNTNNETYKQVIYHLFYDKLAAHSWMEITAKLILTFIFTSNEKLI